MNKCPGLYWQGRRTCSKSLVTSVGTLLSPLLLTFPYQAMSAISRKIQNRKKKEEEDGERTL